MPYIPVTKSTSPTSTACTMIEIKLRARTPTFGAYIHIPVTESTSPTSTALGKLLRACLKVMSISLGLVSE